VVVDAGRRVLEEAPTTRDFVDAFRCPEERSLAFPAYGLACASSSLSFILFLKARAFIHLVSGCTGRMVTRAGLSCVAPMTRACCPRVECPIASARLRACHLPLKSVRTHCILVMFLCLLLSPFLLLPSSSAPGPSSVVSFSASSSPPSCSPLLSPLLSPLPLFLLSFPRFSSSAPLYSSPRLFPFPCQPVLPHSAAASPGSMTGRCSAADRQGSERRPRAGGNDPSRRFQALGRVLDWRDRVQGHRDSRLARLCGQRFRPRAYAADGGATRRLFASLIDAIDNKTLM